MGKKIYITENQFNGLVENKKSNKKDDMMSAIKVARKHRREDDREIFGDGFKAKTRVAKSEKKYSRKGKNKFNGDFYDDDEY